MTESLWGDVAQKFDPGVFFATAERTEIFISVSVSSLMSTYIILRQ